MIFLIDYDRTAGRIVSLRRFEDAAATDATEARLQLELDLNRQGIQREVVLLEAATEEALHRTHRRYFAAAHELTSPAVTSSPTPRAR